MEHQPLANSLPKNPHYRRAASIGLVTATFFIAGVLVAIFSGGWFDGSQFLGGMISLLSLIISIGAWVEWSRAKRVNKLLAAICRREFIAQWKYTTEDWQLFAEREALLIWRELRITIYALIFGSVGGVVLLLVMKANLSVEKPLVMLAIVGITLLIVASIGGIFIWQRLGYLRSIRSQLASPPDTFIGRGFAVSAGTFILWGGGENALSQIVLVSGDVPMVEFCLKGGKDIIKHRVLIPLRYASHAETLIAAMLKGQQISPALNNTSE